MIIQSPKYTPKSKKAKQQIKNMQQSAREIKKKRKLLRESQLGECIQTYSYSDRNAHLNIKSNTCTKHVTQNQTKLSKEMKERDDAARELAKKRTIAPAYNKGPYMVISEENIKDIGK